MVENNFDDFDPKEFVKKQKEEDSKGTKLAERFIRGDKKKKIKEKKISPSLRERFRKEFLEKLGRKKGFKPKPLRDKTSKMLRLQIQREKLKKQLERLRRPPTPKIIKKPVIIPRAPRNEYERAIFDVGHSAQSTVNAGLNASLDVEAGARSTFEQSDREIELIKALLEGRL